MTPYSTWKNVHEEWAGVMTGITRIQRWWFVRGVVYQTCGLCELPFVDYIENCIRLQGVPQCVDD